MSDSTHQVDLNAERAARREAQIKGLHVTLGNAEFDLPPELPVDIFTPFRAIVGDDDLPDIVRQLATDFSEASLTALLKARPHIAVEAFDALRFSLGRLFCSSAENCDLDAVNDKGKPAPVHGGACQWPLFQRQRPSLPDYLALGRGLLAGYGVNLGEASGPSASSGGGGGTSKPTSKRTATASTPAKRSSPRARKASSG